MPTSIEWVRNPDGTKGETWNPVTGCTKISAGCRSCYAERMSKRLAGRYGYPAAPHNFDVTLHPDKLDQPLKWKKPRRVFVCSMGDLFHEDVPFTYITSVLGYLNLASQHTFMILTKRPDRMLEYHQRFAERMGWETTRPLPNLCLGVTVENADQLWRIDHLLATPAAVRFVSCEPLLGPVDFGHLWLGEEHTADCGGCKATPVRGQPYCPGHDAGGIHWIIAGAETGPGARPMDLDWARDLRDQCVAAGVPFFFKRDSDGNRELDGRLWEQWPGEEE